MNNKRVFWLEWIAIKNFSLFFSPIRALDGISFFDRIYFAGSDVLSRFMRFPGIRSVIKWFFFQSSKWSLTFCLRFLHSFVRLFVCSDMKDSLFLCTNFEMRTWNARHEFVVEKFFRMKSFLMKFWVDNTMSFILYQLVNVQITFKTQFWKNLVD